MKKHKYKGEEFKRKVAMEKNDINLDELIDHLIDIRAVFKKRGFTKPSKVQLLITNLSGTEQYEARLATFWICNDQLTLAAESEKSLVVEDASHA